MKKVNIGLDVGIASVGWAIVNADEFEIIDAGSRLFNEANDRNAGSSAATRREYRGRRRNLRRDRLRRSEARDLFIKQGWIKKREDFDLIQPTSKNVYQLRLEALTQPKHPHELMLIFSNFLKHRGVFSLKDEAIEETLRKNKNQDRDEIKKAEQELKNIDDESLWAAEIQLNHLKTKGSVKGSHNKLAHEKYLTELNAILETQKKFGLINEEFKNQFLKLFNLRRQYYEGPGRDSTFGWDGNQKIFYQRLLGFDSYERSEVRAPKMGLYANLFNILNDLNNLTIDDARRETNKLTKYEKEKIVGTIFNTNGKPSNLTLQRLAKILDVKAEAISGYRINKDNKPEFTKFEVLDKIYKWLDKVDLKVNWLDLQHQDLIDDLALIMTQGQSYDYRYEKINDCVVKYGIKEADIIARELSNISFKGSHSLSNKTIKNLLNEMWNEPHSQQEIFSSRHLRPQYEFLINSNTKYIPVAIAEIQRMYISPVAKRSFIQALKVLKAIQQLCEGEYEINGVYIELAREKNSEDQKDLIKLQQKNNERLNQEIRNSIIFTSDDEIKQLSSKVLRKLRLLIEQDAKCAYCFEPLDWYKVKDISSFTEVDHIIPESLSFSSNSDNLVLVHSLENHEKGQKTPYEYFNSTNTLLSWTQWTEKVKTELYKNFLSKNKSSKYISRKIRNLLEETDFSNPDNAKGFIERNLNDTRTSTTYLKEYLEEVSRIQNLNFKIKTINGRFTDYIKRVYFDLPKKNRDYFEHHAIDAIAIAYSDLVRHKKIAPHQWSAYKPEIENHDFLFSRMQNHNLNKQFTDETLYSFHKNKNDEFIKIQKIDIFAVEPSKIKKLGQLLTQDNNKVLMSKADPVTFNYLQQIWTEYPIGTKYMDEEREKTIKNPFVYYHYFLKNPITKRQNKSGPEDPRINAPIKNLKYEDTKLGKHLNVTHKYPLTKENKIVAFESFKPIRLDFYRHKYTNKIRMLMLNIADVTEIKDNEIKIKTNSYERHKRSLKINSDYELIETIFPGDTIEFEQKNKKYLAIAIGGTDVGNKLEVKYLHRNRIKKITNEEKNFDKKQIYVLLSNVTKINKKNFNILGIKKSEYMLEFN